MGHIRAVLTLDKSLLFPFCSIILHISKAEAERTLCNPVMWPLTGPKYPEWLLGIYEVWLMYVANPFILNCSPTKHLLPLHAHNVGQAHCDVGVGSGFYLANTAWPKPEKGQNSLTLIDIEEAPLRIAAQRILGAHSHVQMHKLQMDILLSGEANIPGVPFDSISLIYVLHTLNATIQEKAVALGRLRDYVKPDGVVFGATILGKNKAVHGLAAKVLITLLVAGGILNNADDDAETYKQTLEQNFRHVDTKIVGSALLFTARGPKS